MSAYTKLNLIDDVEDMAPRFGHAPHMQSRFARGPLGLERQGLSHFRLAPGYRQPFGHDHREQEEVYVVLAGDARMKIGDEIVELRQWDAVRIGPDTPRGLEAGRSGADILVVGAPNVRDDTVMLPGWWSD